LAISPELTAELIAKKNAKVATPMTSTVVRSVTSSSLHSCRPSAAACDVAAAVKTATYRVVVGVKTAGIRWSTATTATQQLAVLTHRELDGGAIVGLALAPILGTPLAERPSMVWPSLAEVIAEHQHGCRCGVGQGGGRANVGAGTRRIRAAVDVGHRAGAKCRPQPLQHGRDPPRGSLGVPAPSHHDGYQLSSKA
jgi:hypothetical protein